MKNMFFWNRIGYEFALTFLGLGIVWMVGRDGRMLIIDWKGKIVFILGS